MKKKSIKSEDVEEKVAKKYIDSMPVIFKEKDYLGNYIYSNELRDKINNYFKSDNKKPFYIGVVGTWGSGKTSVVNMALGEVKATKFNYDAWKYEGDSFRRNFIEDILSQSKKCRLTEKDISDIKNSLYEDYSISANSMIKRIELSREKDKVLNWISIVALVFVSAVAIAIGIYSIIKEKVAVGNILTLIGTMGIYNIFYSTTVYSKSRAFSSEQFYEKFIKILKSNKGKNNVVVIDNLDRCNSSELRQTFSIIKGFYVDDKDLNNEKIVFIIPLDIESMQKEEAYGDMAIYYLDKIFDDIIYIKRKYNTDKLDFINQILDEYPDIKSIMSSVAVDLIVKSNINTPRKIIKTINDYVTEYDILLNKNSKGFVEEEKNRNYIMKMVILKREYYNFYKLAYEDLKMFRTLENVPSSQEHGDKLDDYDKESNGYLKKFLNFSKPIKPTNYNEFFQNQEIKKYNQLPQHVKDAIMNHESNDIETIVKYNEKNKILDFYNNIYDDVANELWLSILHKYIAMIELFKHKYFTKEELEKVMNSWKIVFENPEFIKLVKEQYIVIGFENELIFGTEMCKDDAFNTMLLNCLRDEVFKYETEDEKYDNLSKWLEKNEKIELNEEYTNLINLYSQYLLNNNLYSDMKHLRFLFGKNIRRVSPENIRQFISKNRDNVFIINLLNNLKTEGIDDELITIELRNWFKNNEVSSIDVLISTLEYFTYNNHDISTIAINNVKFPTPETVDESKIKYIIDMYIENNAYNDALFRIIMNFTSEKKVNYVLASLTCNIPEDNEGYISFFKDYFFSLLDEIKKKYVSYLIKVVKLYIDYEQTILEQIINDGLLYNYYRALDKAEDKEHIADIAILMLANDFTKQINNIFIYESSRDRMESLVSTNNSISKYVDIINAVKKVNFKDKLINDFIKELQDRDNVTDMEKEKINTLNVDDLTKDKIKEVLNLKESNEQELVEV